ncbi:MAG TPA: hypothetical protein PLX70_09150, partial [Solirubrobacterales bacterium]|nr:hypothetical protein [Solirubrobacterales bacterium]
TLAGRMNDAMRSNARLALEALVAPDDTARTAITGRIEDNRRVVTATLAEEVPAVESMIGLPLGPGAVAELAGKVNRWLALDPAERLEIGQNIAESADRNWSWQGVAKDVISASAGQVRKVVQS